MNRDILKNNPYTMCFACGKDNDMGLRMRFEIEEDCIRARFTPKPQHQSYSGRVHGGIVAVLLDEVTGNYLYCKEGVPAYTARMEIRYRAPLLIGEEVICEGRELKRRGRMVEMLGTVRKADGTVLAESFSRMMLEEKK